MNYEVVYLKEKIVAGIKIRTNNMGLYCNKLGEK